MNYNILIWIAVFHLLDMVFTILLIKKTEKYYKNAYLLELNYHKWFFKKFGVIKGFMLSVPISLSLLLFLGYMTLGTNVVYIIFGMVMAFAYQNVMSWVSFDRISKEVKRK